MESFVNQTPAAPRLTQEPFHPFKDKVNFSTQSLLPTHSTTKGLTKNNEKTFKILNKTDHYLKLLKTYD